MPAPDLAQEQQQSGLESVNVGVAPVVAVVGQSDSEGTSLTDESLYNTELEALASLWLSMVEQLGLKAYSSQLARQSELVLLDEQRLELRCEKRSLASDDKAIVPLREAITHYFETQNRPVPKLCVHIVEAGQVVFSPQKTAVKLREDALLSAKQALAEHATIQSLIREFDGMILPNSIEPSV